jgi:hypothetical protein
MPPLLADVLLHGYRMVADPIPHGQPCQFIPLTSKIPLSSLAAMFICAPELLSPASTFDAKRAVAV